MRRHGVERYRTAEMATMMLCVALSCLIAAAAELSFQPSARIASIRNHDKSSRRKMISLRTNFNCLLKQVEEIESMQGKVKVSKKAVVRFQTRSTVLIRMVQRGGLFNQILVVYPFT